jgi:hypothetical protein
MAAFPSLFGCTQEELLYLEDASNELILLDEDEPVRYVLATPTHCEPMQCRS